MERKKYLLVLMLCLSAYIVNGQNSSSIYQAYINGDINKWKSTLSVYETNNNKTNKQKLDLVNYQYGYIAWCINHEKYIEAETLLEESKIILNDLESQNYKLSMVNAYKAAYIGFEIGITPIKASVIGPKSLSFANLAVELDPANPFAYEQLGNISFYTPKLLGGSKQKAIEYYLTALNLIHKSNYGISNNWNYLNLYVTIIEAYVELEKYNLAKKYCVMVLNIEPNFDWVKNTLYPQVLEKI